MFITKETLEKYNACEQGIKFLEKYFPDGAEMLELIQTRHIPHDMLHWGYEHLNWNKDELDMYCKVLEIVDSEYFYSSEKLFDSSFITNSKGVYSSSFVFDSQNIRSSKYIYNSKDVDNSNIVSESSFVYDSKKIYNSANITNCSNMLDIIYGLNSKNCIRTKGAVESSEIFNSAATENCHFCASVDTLTNCLFCFDINDQENMLFNRPISEKVLTNIKTQYLNIMKDFSIQISEPIPEGSVNDKIKLNTDFCSYFSNIPQTFWNWVKTLPNYDAEIMYKITLNPVFLEN